jgi:peptidoglycan/LPS O-acetylase OafA/YrhL
VNLAKGTIATVLPAVIVAARFFVPGDWDNSYTWFFGVTGLVATFLGCLAAVVLLHRQLAHIPMWVLALIAVVVAGVLLAIFPTMPSWPFAGVGFIVAWVLMAAGFTAVLVYGAGHRYA